MQCPPGMPQRNSQDAGHLQMAIIQSQAPLLAYLQLLLEGGLILGIGAPKNLRRAPRASYSRPTARCWAQQGGH